MATDVGAAGLRSLRQVIIEDFGPGILWDSTLAWIGVKYTVYLTLNTEYVQNGGKQLNQNILKVCLDSSSNTASLYFNSTFVGQRECERAL